MGDTTHRRNAVWRLLLDLRWHSTMEINAISVGGSEGCRRLREIRRDIREGNKPGFIDIIKRKMDGDTTQWEYQLVPGGDVQSTINALRVEYGTSEG